MSEKPPEKPKPNTRFFADVLTFGWVLPAAIGAGAGVGWLADRFLKTFPVLTIVFGLLGAAAGLRQIYAEFIAISKDQDEPPR